MALDQIKQVAEAEANSKAAKEACRVSGQEQIAKANEEAAETAAYAKAEAHESAKKLMQQAEESAKKASERTLAQAESRCSSLKQAAQGKLSDAANLITERVVNSQWQS